MHSESSPPKRGPTRKSLRVKGRYEAESEDSGWCHLLSASPSASIGRRSDRNPKAGAGKESLDARAFAVRIVLEKSLELYKRNQS